MTKILALLLSTQLPLVQAWAPIDSLSYAQLPKTLEFAKKAWSFPSPEDVNGPQVLLEDVLSRTLPWTYRQQEDSYFFDGYSGAANEWPSPRAFRKKTRSVPKVTPKQETLEAADYYYDDMGNLMSWNVPSKEEHHYFDGIGSSHVWASSASAVQVQKESTPKQEEALETADFYYDDMGSLVRWAFTQKKDEHHYFESIGAGLAWSDVVSVVEETAQQEEEELETADHYYDDMGNQVHWSIPKQDKHHFFEGIGTSRVWSSVENLMHKKTPKESLANFGLEDDCEHSYYSDTGDRMCWVGQ